MSRAIGQAPPRNKEYEKEKEEIRRIKYEHESFKPDPIIQQTVSIDQMGVYEVEEQDGFNNRMVRNNYCPICGEEWIPYCNDADFCAIPCEYGKAVLVCSVHKTDLLERYVK